MTDGFPAPYTLEKAQEFIEKVNQQERNLFYAIEYKEKLSGSISAVFFEDVYRKNVSIAYFIGEPYWNKGIASSSIKILCEYLFKNYEIERIFAEPFERNTASHKALIKAGFFKEATLKKNVYKNGELIDSCIFACLKESHVKRYVFWEDQ